jgi:hypothetical protein
VFLQVLMQLIAFRTRPKITDRRCALLAGGNSDGQEKFFGFTTNQIIMLSIFIAVLNLFKTIATLYYEAASLEMGMMQYIRCVQG